MGGGEMQSNLIVFIVIMKIFSWYGQISRKGMLENSEHHAIQKCIIGTVKLKLQSFELKNEGTVNHSGNSRRKQPADNLSAYIYKFSYALAWKAEQLVTAH